MHITAPLIALMRTPMHHACMHGCSALHHIPHTIGNSGTVRCREEAIHLSHAQSTYTLHISANTNPACPSHTLMPLMHSSDTVRLAFF
eukprot:NODE_4272_length_482_cov_175.411085_g3666_i0.p1 GENE.NODE_4272_length_482_cov_175.411085_g3666_i0~~NODE_4272_length_482_cov_175.411085_g3666_i0.p1  ORF type:complete len:88 (+),score=12.40 NODE_4272_length_482_cov_175.411085_g3666_i0:161-424(+)